VSIVALIPGGARVETLTIDESARRLIGTWSSNHPRGAIVKTFRSDGTYSETSRFLGARATVTGIYRLEGQQLWWVEQKLTINRAGGDVLPPTGHVRLNEEQKVTIKWKGADQFVILGDRTMLYQRVRP
jgi:hypothetical protein